MSGKRTLADGGTLFAGPWDLSADDPDPWRGDPVVSAAGIEPAGRVSAFPSWTSAPINCRIIPAAGMDVPELHRPEERFPGPTPGLLVYLVHIGAGFKPPAGLVALRFEKLCFDKAADGVCQLLALTVVNVQGETLAEIPEGRIDSLQAEVE